MQMETQTKRHHVIFMKPLKSKKAYSEIHKIKSRKLRQIQISNIPFYLIPLKVL